MSLSVPEDARLEIKFVSYASNFDALKSWIHLHPSGFYSPFPDRQVNNIYFDGHQYTAYTENLSGASERTKVRYRWYGASIEPCAGTLEIKRKRNYFGWKIYHRVENAPYNPEKNWNSIRKNIRDQISKEGRFWLDLNPFPILLNRYRRRYFISRNKKIRVTVDTNQAVWDQRFKSKPNFLNKANLPDSLIVEIKFDRKDREYASQTIQGLPLRVSRHSKYMTGVNTISGN
jgi:SPX domain protein involved in polyphosphate accumulation